MNLWDNHWVSLSVRDYLHPEKYIGEKETPVMVHRAVLGSYERFLVLLLEQFKGVLPLWLSPVQVNIIPVNIKYHDEDYKELKQMLQKEKIRVNYDNSKEQMNKKIRESNILKNSYIIIIGDKERDNNSISYKKLGEENTITISKEEFLQQINEEINKR